MSNSYPFRRTVTLTKDSTFHHAHPGSSGPVRVPMTRNQVQNEDPYNYRDDQLDAFKGSIYRHGYASCPDPRCRLSFLSLAGIVAHKKNCAGFLRQGDFVTCSFCEARFCQYKSLQTHQERSHGERQHLQQQGHHEEEAVVEESLETKHECVDNYETMEEQNRRLMLESRHMSNPRPRGRPTKNSNKSSIHELDYSYYARHSSRYTVLDTEPEEDPEPSHQPQLSLSRVMKVRTNDGNILYVRPTTREQLREEENMSSSSSTSGSARSAHKTYMDEKSRRPNSNHVVGPLEQLEYVLDDVKNEEERISAASSRASTSSNASKKNSLEEQRAILEAYEEIVLRSEALAENAKKKIKEKNELLKKEKDLKTWEEDLRRREAKAQRTINAALFSLGSESLEDCVKGSVIESSPNASSVTVIDLCDDVDKERRDDCYILPDSTHSVPSVGSAFSASSYSINEDNMSDSISIAASLTKETNETNSISSPEPLGSSPPSHVSDDQHKRKILPNGLIEHSDCDFSEGKRSGVYTGPRKVSKKNIGRNKRFGKSGGRGSSLHRQIKQFLNCIDTSSLRAKKTASESSDTAESTPSVISNSGGIKVIKPVKIPSNAEPSNFKSTPSGVKYIVPSSCASRSPQSEWELVEGRIDKSRNALISELATNPSDGKCLSSSSPNCTEEVISSDLPNCFPNNEDSIAAEGETKETMDTSNLESYILVKSPTISVIDIKDHFYPLPENTEEINESVTSCQPPSIEVPPCTDKSPSPVRAKRGEQRKSNSVDRNIDSSPARSTRSCKKKADCDDHSTNNEDISSCPEKNTVPTTVRSKRGRKRKTDNKVNVSGGEDSSIPGRSTRSRTKKAGSTEVNARSEECTISTSTPIRSTRVGRRRISNVELQASDTEVNDSIGHPSARDEEHSVPTSTQARSTRDGRRKKNSVEVNDSVCDEECSIPTSTPVRSKRGMKRKGTPGEVTPSHSESITPSKLGDSVIGTKIKKKPGRKPKKLSTSCVNKETPSKRGRKRRKIEVESPDKLGKSSTPKKNKTKVNCGKCDKSYCDPQSLKVHIASSHGGIAREAGQSQDFTDGEIDAAIKQAFKLISTVVCYKCCTSSFTTRAGLIYHIQRCGKTYEELEAEKVPCPHCSYRGFSTGLKHHMKVHHVPPPMEEPIIEVTKSSSGGRIRRNAACRASKIMNETIASLQEEGDDRDSEPKNGDQEFKLTDEINAEEKYKQLGSKLFQCKACRYEDSTRKGIICHIISAHSEDDHDEEISDAEERPLNLEKKVSLTVDNSAHRSAKYRPYGSQGKCKALSPCGEHMTNELKFRIANYSSKGDLFQKIISNEFFKVSSILKAESYLPTSEESISFTFKRSSDCQFGEKVSLKRFEGACLGGVPTFFAGGPIWTLEWAPQTGEKDEFFALSTHRSMDDVSAMFSLDFGLGIIQIWSGGVLKATQDEASAPVFKYGLLHDYGKIWCLKWCPSGTDTADHLGLLAAGCSNGNIYVHRMRRPDAEEASAFYNHTPEMCLRPLRESFGQCLKLSWYNGKDHRVLGASYSGGKIALYDLLTDSILLKKGSVIYPYKVLHVHTSSVNAIDLLGTEPFPRYCATGSFDRHFSVWDLNDPLVPVINGKKGLVTDIHFFRSFPGGHVAMSHDDVYLQSHTQTVISEPGYSRVKTQPILCHNSAIRNESLNFWLGTLGVGTSAGEVIVFVAPQSISSLETDKFTTRRRTLISRTSVSYKDVNKNSHKYDECRDNMEEFGYINMNLNDFSKNPEFEVNATRSADRLALEDITNYPMAAINPLAFNPNFRSCSWLLSGSQNGIGRLHNVKALLHSSFPTTLQTYIDLFECSG